MDVEENSSNINSSEDEDGMETEDNKHKSQNKDKQVYLPGKTLDDNEELVHDPKAYVMLHLAQTVMPCLSFDILRDDLGYNRETFPQTAYCVTGTQAHRPHLNNIIVMKMSNLDKNHTKEKNEDSDDSDESDSDSDEEEEKLAELTHVTLKHQGSVNRIRSTILNNKHFAASWSELGRVNIWDLSAQIDAVNNPSLLEQYNDKPEDYNSLVFSFSGHQQEGFGVDWCPTDEGVLATGDCRRDIHIWTPKNDSWHINQHPLVGHTASVEDLQWSPNEKHVLASCSVDKSIRIWDTRVASSKACMLVADNAHESDVNVISWNRNEPFIVSGGDDGVLHIWDLRLFQTKTPVATFKHHTSYVTTVEWHPNDATVFASGGADNQICQWDLAVEADGTEEVIEGVAPQVLFIHQGQTDIKELHWHPQIPGVIISTALNGFNIFRTISV